MNSYVNVTQMVEHELYQAVLSCTKYDQILYKDVSLVLLSTVNAYYKYQWLDAIGVHKALVAKVLQDFSEYQYKNPQFQGVSKGIVLNLLAKHSVYFQDKVTDVQVVRQVTYTPRLYLERLIGYMEWLRVDTFTPSEFKKKIDGFNAREKKHIQVEPRAVAEGCNNLYTVYKKSVEGDVSIDKHKFLERLREMHFDLFLGG